MSLFTTSTVLGLALFQAHSNVTLKRDAAAARELEGIEDRGQHSLLSLILPFSEDGRISGTAILIRHQVLSV